MTGGREVHAVLTVRPDGLWDLSEGSLQDVTHLSSRLARFSPAAEGAFAFRHVPCLCLLQL